MTKILIGIALALFAVSSANAQSGSRLPSSTEITALREKVSKSVDKYEPLLARQPYADLEQYDKQAKEVGELRTYLKRIEARPQAFNGILGFVFLETLHDVEGFAGDCAQTGVAGRDAGLTNACQDSALALVDAINSTQDLYARYITVVSEQNCSPSHPDDSIDRGRRAPK
ncbi:MAG: hypothetical protein ACYC92_06115 [Candidatus Acidiferrales bacterium]